MPTLRGWERLPGRVLCSQQDFGGRLPEQGFPGEKPPIGVCVVFMTGVLTDSLQFSKATNQKNHQIFPSLQMWEVEILYANHCVDTHTA